jgi:site-specific recombinase XerD
MGEITLRKALDDYKTVYMPYRNYAERTRVEYLNDLEDLIKFIEQLGIEEAKEIGLPQLERYLAELDHRGIAGSTRKRKAVAIRSFLTFLYQDQYIDTNLAKQLIPPFAEAKSPRYLTKPEYEHLLAACANNPRDYALIQLLLQTGIKLSELTQLTINDVELPEILLPDMKEDSYLHIRVSERRKGRIVSLNQKASLAIYSHLCRRPETTIPALFINRFRKPISLRGVEKIVNKYLRKVGILNANVQSLRHTFGVYQIAQGTDIKTIQKLMGYEDPRSITIYVSLASALINREVQDPVF